MARGEPHPQGSAGLAARRGVDQRAQHSFVGSRGRSQKRAGRGAQQAQIADRPAAAPRRDLRRLALEEPQVSGPRDAGQAGVDRAQGIQVGRLPVPDFEVRRGFGREIATGRCGADEGRDGAARRESERGVQRKRHRVERVLHQAQRGARNVHDRTHEGTAGALCLGHGIDRDGTDARGVAARMHEPGADDLPVLHRGEAARGFEPQIARGQRRADVERREGFGIAVPPKDVVEGGHHDGAHARHVGFPHPADGQTHARFALPAMPDDRSRAPFPLSRRAVVPGRLPKTPEPVFPSKPLLIPSPLVGEGEVRSLYDSILAETARGLHLEFPSPLGLRPGDPLPSPPPEGEGTEREGDER